MQRVAEVSKSDMAEGGASRVAEELVIGLRLRGVSCEHWMGRCNKGFDYEHRFPLHDYHPRLTSRIRRIEGRLGIPDLLPFEDASITRSMRKRKYDVLHFHDLSSAISPDSVRLLARKCPTVWTFHDCSPFTGGCLYPMTCERFKMGCGSCPQRHRWPLGGKFDCTRLLCSRKKALHSEGCVLTVAPSKWMADMAMSSGMLTVAPRVIPNGVDVNVFCPNGTQKDAKSFLGIDKERPVILVSANSLSDERKGAVYSFEAIRAIQDLRPFVIAVGNPNADIERFLSGIDYLCTGFISDQRLLAKWYALADVFVFCSLADNMPLSILETMACGVPIVGFKTGGIPEIVEQGVTGFLVEQKDQVGLNDALRRALTNGDVKKWGNASRQKAMSEYAMDRFISAHMSLYDEVIAAFKEKQ